MDDNAGRGDQLGAGIAGARPLLPWHRPREQRRYARLACAAGARLTGEDFDTVAVTFEVVPRRDGYELENVRFFGGPGIP